MNKRPGNVILSGGEEILVRSIRKRQKTDQYRNTMLLSVRPIVLPRLSEALTSLPA